jgi:predicted pyridoxine 5'-phosphate oxidase superfamily flavin-nucleotide-binding protein
MIHKKMQKRILSTIPLLYLSFFIPALFLLIGLVGKVQAQTPPDNDDCANAITLTSTTSFTGITGTTIGATQSLPAITCNADTGTADDDVWFKFTAVATGHIVTVIGGEGFDPIIDVRSGACNGSTIGCADATIHEGTETVVLSGLTIGNTYYIRVYSYGNLDTERGTFTIGVTHVVNDNCANAITLTSANFFIGTTGTTMISTQSLPAITCNANTGTADDDVWYKFTAVATSHAVTVIGGEGFDPVVDVRSGACNGSTIACVDNIGGGKETVVLTGLTIGNTYYIRVYSAGGSDSDRGTFTIGVIHITNDNCANAFTLTSATSFVGTTSTTITATQSLPAVVCNSPIGEADDDVWFKFTASSTGHNITVIGEGGFDPVIDVRSGACNGTTIACAEDTGGGGTETVILSALTIGSTYYVRVYSSFDRGTFTIGLMHSINDDCTNAISLTSATSFAGIAGATQGASQSLPPITCNADTGTADDDVWYKFTAVSTSHTVMVIGGGETGFDPVVDVRSGACNGITIDCADATKDGETETVRLSGLTIGSTYYIRVYSYGDLTIERGIFTIGVMHLINDNCTDAITLTSATYFTGIAGTTMIATQSLPAITCNADTGTADDDVWYKFTAVATKQIVTVMGEGGFDPVIDVRSGACNGITIACGSEIVVLSGLTIGNTYYIRVYGYGSLEYERGEFTIGVVHVVNDDCANAITLTSATSFTGIPGTTLLSTQSLPAITCNANTGTADDDVWYKFVAVSTNHTVIVSSAFFDAVIDVRSGACNGITIACADDAGEIATETVGLSGLTIGNTYYIRVYSPGGADSNRGTFTIGVIHIINDNCANAITLTSANSFVGFAGTTMSATQSLPAIECNAFTGTADDDVWYKFVAVSTNHTVTVMGGDGFDALIDVRSGACNGINIGCADDTFNGETEIVVLSGLTIGNTYHIRVYSPGGEDSNRGTFTIGVTHVGCAANLAVAQPYTSGTVLLKAFRITATNQVSGAKVTYQGAQSITLQPGFSAIIGAGNYFQAIIAGCP